VQIINDLPDLTAEQAIYVYAAKTSMEWNRKTVKIFKSSNFQRKVPEGL